MKTQYVMYKSFTIAITVTDCRIYFPDRIEIFKSLHAAKIWITKHKL